MQSGGCGGEVAQSCLTLATPRTVACQAPLSMDSPGKNAGVGSHSLLQGIFPTQGLKADLLHCRQILYCLSYRGSPTAIHIYLLWNTSSFLDLTEIYKLCLMAQMVKNLPTVQKTLFDPCERKIPWRREWQSTPVFLHGGSHGERSLLGYSPWVAQLDFTFRLTLLLYTFSNLCHCL